MNTIRTLAMQWFNPLSSAEKTRLVDNNTKLVGSPRRWETVTGSEIENIFYNEVILKWFEAHPLYHLCNGMQKETIIAAYLQEHSNTSTPAKVFDELNDMMDSNPLFKEHSKEEPKQCCDSGIVNDFCINTLKCKHAVGSSKQETLEDIKLEVVLESSHCQFSVVENKLATIYRNQEKILKAIKLLNNGK
jgi:hypothetical protein